MNARTLRAVTNLGLVVLFAAAYLVPAITHDTPRIGLGQQVQTQDVTDSTPTWNREAAKALPGCEDKRDGVLYPDVAVVRLSGTLERMPLDDAWARNHNTLRGDDVWVIGGCQ